MPSASSLYGDLGVELLLDDLARREALDRQVGLGRERFDAAQGVGHVLLFRQDLPQVLEPVLQFADLGLELRQLPGRGLALGDVGAERAQARLSHLEIRGDLRHVELPEAEHCQRRHDDECADLGVPRKSRK